MRSIVSIALLAVFVVPFFCGPTWLSVEKKQIQKHVRNHILPNVDASELLTFKFSLSDTVSQLNWKHAKEFEFQGKMFDIVERHYTGEEVTYLVWQDDEETQINTKIKLLANSIFDASSEHQNRQLSFHLFVKTLFVENQTEPQLFGYSSNNKIYFSWAQNNLSDGFNGALFNPPRV
jgi:hypothetical protein